MLNTLIDSLLGLLFPDRCASCGKVGALFCKDCHAAIEPYPDRQKQIDGIDQTVIACTFGGPLRPAIHALKYARRRRMAAPLGELLVEQLRSTALNADAIIPVPLHPSRQRQRGFNQSELLALPVAAYSQMPLLTNGLVRVRATEQQAHLDAHSRRANMRAAFAWHHHEPPPARVLLVDDVLTTGATIVACAAALRAAGSREIHALALARSRPGD